MTMSSATNADSSRFNGTIGLRPKLKAKVTVREPLDGRIKLFYKTTELEYVEFEQLRRKEELATRSA